jgi:hypothetical protein
MAVFKARALAVVIGLSFVGYGQQTPPASPQTARQALIEMITGGNDGVTKHLTVEVQQAFKPGTKPQIGFPDVRLCETMDPGAPMNMQTFDSGPVLLFCTARDRRWKVETRVDGEELSGDEDKLDLSMHILVDGQERDRKGWNGLSLSRFAVNMKRQQSVWRLDQITIYVGLLVGDPESLAIIAGQGQGGDTTAGSACGIFLPWPHKELLPVSPVEKGRPRATAEELVVFMAARERWFAEEHPDVGFTCSLGDVMESPDARLDRELKSGTYDNYHYALSGCHGKPAGSFQITAEPLAAGPGRRAFCTDATLNVRVSEDGRATTCLAAGKVLDEADAANGMTGAKRRKLQHK